MNTFLAHLPVKSSLNLCFISTWKFFQVKHTLSNKYCWSTVRRNHCHQLMGHHFSYLTYLFFSELTLALITAQNMASAQPVCLYRAGCTVSVTSTGKERPVIFHIVKPTVGVRITATVT